MTRLKLILPALLTVFSAVGFSQIKLPRLISDGVVLQRDVELKLWGWASPGEAVELKFKENRYAATADKTGNWAITLPAQRAGGPYDLEFTGKDTITVWNVLFGDVWVCSGQSNMELTLERVKEKYSQEIAQSENPFIRQFTVADKYDFKKMHDDLDSGSWLSAGPENVLSFSAVAWFFAKELYERYQVPVGLINAALGGSPVEAWISEDKLKAFPEAYNELQRFKSDSLIAAIELADKSRTDSWYSELDQKDKGLSDTPQWYEEGLDDSDWFDFEIPAFWESNTTGGENGVVWFRREIRVPESMAGKPAQLWLGRIVDQDYAYLNGTVVGTTGYQYPPRRYTVPAGLLKEGLNTLAVRVISNSGTGGFVPDKPYYLAAGNDTIHLEGAWKQKRATTMPPLESQTFVRWKPAGLFNRMISPLLNYSIKGVIWYQGESNTSNPQGYAKAFPVMINDWRERWGLGDFPFIFVQLANYLEETETPVESDWAELRQSQAEALKLPSTGMAVAIDLGEWNDIHPLNKKDVGRRLALQARRLAYNETDLPASSPVPSGYIFGKKEVKITFANAGSGLTSCDGGSLNHFAVSGKEGKFYWAEATAEGNVVTVTGRKVKNPVAVRYAWADNPASANLCSEEGLPAAPFEIRDE